MLLPTSHFFFNTNNSGLIARAGSASLSAMTWHIKGSTLTLDEDSAGPWPEITLQTLDRKHLVFTVGENQRSSYLNMDNVLPGTWIISWPNRWYLVDIDKDGTSSWKKDGTTYAGEYNWETGTGGDSFLSFHGENWNETLYFASVQEDLVITETNERVQVTLERVRVVE